MNKIEIYAVEVSGVKIEVSAYKDEKAYRLFGSNGTWFFPDKENSDEEIIAHLIQRVLYPSQVISSHTITLVGA